MTTEHCGARSLAFFGYDSECVRQPKHWDNHENDEGRQWVNLVALAEELDNEYGGDE